MKFQAHNRKLKTGKNKSKAFCVRIILAVVLAIAFAFYAYLYINYTTPILMYHSFDQSRLKDFAVVSNANFYKQMKFIKEKGYKVISLNDYCRLLKYKKPIPRNLVVLTIDDGYKDNLDALKILKEFDFPATLFLIVDRIGKPGFLSEGDIRSNLSGTKITIGSHTLTHPDLSKISDDELKKEISDSKSVLERKFKTKIDAIAYPGGAYDKRAIKEVENSGYLCACATNRGFSRKLNRFSLRRIKATNRDTKFSLWSKLSGFYNVFKKVKKPY
ncbi:MAG: polysaccharide deacetylase family protein [Candidatus Omnitrophica bacterium]|jgi:peptidoglycan/xylan/chitin deacetylase (PgdA/CDA1 family)|nr:polysaccharide deacetylase family protein [Candidatus Omnitrophota bacterium]